MTPPRAVHVLMDNEAPVGFHAEWGLCLAIDLGASGDGGPLWLLDTGNTEAFLVNAAAMGLAPASAQGLVLSHGHYDHTGGLPALLQSGFSGDVYAHPDCTAMRYNHSEEVREIGIPRAAMDVLTFIPVHGVEQLAPGLHMFANIPRNPGNFEAVDGFSFDPEGTRPDPVADDVFLVLDTPPGPVAIMGCCHSGLANSLHYMRETLGIDRLHAVMGGMHLYKTSDQVLEQAAQTIEEFGVELVVPGHCTGVRGCAFLQGRLACEVRPMASGKTVRFG